MGEVAGVVVDHGHMRALLWIMGTCFMHDYVMGNEVLYRFYIGCRFILVSRIYAASLS